MEWMENVTPFRDCVNPGFNREGLANTNGNSNSKEVFSKFTKRMRAKVGNKQCLKNIMFESFLINCVEEVNICLVSFRVFFDHFIC